MDFVNTTKYFKQYIKPGTYYHSTCILLELLFQAKQEEYNGQNAGLRVREPLFSSSSGSIAEQKESKKVSKSLRDSFFIVKLKQKHLPFYQLSLMKIKLYNEGEHFL